MPEGAAAAAAAAAAAEETETRPGEAAPEASPLHICAALGQGLASWVKPAAPTHI